MSERTINRRAFLKRAAGTACAAGFPMIIPSSVLGLNGAVAPSERIVIGSIGLGGQGTYNLGNFLQKPQVQVAAVCDVDAGSQNYMGGFLGGLEPARLKVEEAYGKDKADAQWKGCATYHDFRELLARQDIDAVVICTPDHWHGLISQTAAKAGKDIYCEKPLTNTIAEGRAVCDAVKKYGRILQTGSHERSRPNARYACELIRNGRIGKLHTIRVNMPNTDGHHMLLRSLDVVHAEEPVPEGFDYDLWQGPVPARPYTKDRCHFWWRFHLDYGGGEITDRGAHIIDLAQLGRGTDDTGPLEIRGKGEMLQGGHFKAFIDYQFECVYADGVRLIGTTNTPRGVKFEGDEGWIFIHVHGGELEADPKSLLESVIRPGELALGRSVDHHQNFIDAMLTRRDPFATAEIGHRSATICHLLNIAMLTEQPLKWDPVREQISNCEEANRMISRPMRSPWRF